jgi:hypothetical protein
MTIFGRWLPALTGASLVSKSALVRKGALGIAGLAVAGSAFAGPATTAHAAPPEHTKPVAAVQQADKPKGVKNLAFSYQEQPNVYYCGPAATRIALSAHGKAPSQHEVAKKLGTTEAGTDSVNHVTRVLNQTYGKNVYKTTEIPSESASTKQVQQMKTNLKNAIDHKRVPVVNVIGSATDTDGDEHSFPTGHYLTVVGYAANGDKVKIADPWQPVGDGTYWMTTGKLGNWAASRGYSA